jgi:hypothetical protein
MSGVSFLERLDEDHGCLILWRDPGRRERRMRGNPQLASA